MRTQSVAPIIRRATKIPMVSNNPSIHACFESVRLSVLSGQEETHAHIDSTPAGNGRLALKVTHYYTLVTGARYRRKKESSFF